MKFSFGAFGGFGDFGAIAILLAGLASAPMVAGSGKDSSGCEEFLISLGSCARPPPADVSTKTSKMVRERRMPDAPVDGLLRTAKCPGANAQPTGHARLMLRFGSIGSSSCRVYSRTCGISWHTVFFGITNWDTVPISQKRNCLLTGFSRPWRDCASRTAA